MASDLAGEGTTAVQIEVRAPDDCVTAASFFDRVHARTERVRLARAGETAPAFRVAITATSGRYVGTVVLGGEGEPREIIGGSCDEVASGLAITVALSIDERARDEEKEAPPVAAVPARPVEAPVKLVTPERPREPPTPPATRWSAALGVEGSALSMGSLGALASPGVFGEIGSSARSVWAPRLRLSGATFGGSTDAVDGATSAFRWWVGRLDACPVQAHLVESLAVRPCLGVEAGTLSAEAAGVGQAARENRPWVAIRAMANVTWRVAGPVFLQILAGVAIPATRERFVFAPSERVFRAPEIAVSAGAAAGITFP